jgi:ketol-acid reductoisomerase
MPDLRLWQPRRCESCRRYHDLINDEKQPDMYEKDILPNLTKAKPSHSPRLQYPFPENRTAQEYRRIHDCPQGPGHTVRSEYTIGRGVPCLYAVYQDYSGNCRDIAFAYGHGIGGSRAGLLETSFRERPRPIFSVSRLFFAAAYPS